MAAPLIDTHCHLNFDAFDADRDAVIQRAHDEGVARILIPAVDIQTGAEAVQLSADYPGTIFAAVGIHPNGTAALQDDGLLNDQIAQIREQSQAAGVVAIGEIGLDYYWDNSPHDVQQKAFRAQLDLARELEFPVIIHNREASDDVLAILAEWVATLPPALKERPGVMHSFSAPREAAETALALGFYLGFTGPITYKNANDLRLIASAVPVDRVLVETDAPYLTPTPHRGKRNEPAYVRHVAERLAVLHGRNTAEDESAFFAQTTANADRLFTRLSTNLRVPVTTAVQ